MKDILKNWPDLSKRITKYKNLLLLSDFDGTLCKIVRFPNQVKLTKNVKSSLRDFKKLPDVLLGIVSGRPLDDIKKIVGLRKIFYVGNHGFEIEYINKKGKKERFVHPDVKNTLPRLGEISDKLKKQLKKIKGANIENKIYTLSLHYRNVDKKDTVRLRSIFFDIIKPYLELDKVKITKGKKVYEVRPPINWHKGKAVKKIKDILNKEDLITIYLGDDVTDEDAFLSLNKEDISVFIGEKNKSNADFRIKDVNAVSEFLRRLYKLKAK